MNTIIDKVNSWLDGKKTIIGVIGVILGAFAYFFSEGLADGFQLHDISTLVTQISAGFTALGLGGKLEKLKNAIKEK